ncbi:MAG: hypothetical protein JNM94_08140 [Phycisphaerae bacterium]|nr:hypothetical protein [Phycisphaerae bacterium]
MASHKVISITSDTYDLIRATANCRPTKLKDAAKAMAVGWSFLSPKEQERAWQTVRAGSTPSNGDRTDSRSLQRQKPAQKAQDAA